MDLRKETVVTAVASQGLNFPLGNWVKKYSLNYSCDGLNWQTYQSLDKYTVRRTSQMTHLILSQGREMLNEFRKSVVFW